MDGWIRPDHNLHLGYVQFLFNSPVVHQDCAEQCEGYRPNSMNVVIDRYSAPWIMFPFTDEYYPRPGLHNTSEEVNEREYDDYYRKTNWVVDYTLEGAADAFDEWVVSMSDQNAARVSSLYFYFPMCIILLLINNAGTNMGPRTCSFIFSPCAGKNPTGWFQGCWAPQFTARQFTSGIVESFAALRERNQPIGVSDLQRIANFMRALNEELTPSLIYITPIPGFAQCEHCHIESSWAVPTGWGNILGPLAPTQRIDGLVQSGTARPRHPAAVWPNGQPINFQSLGRRGPPTKWSCKPSPGSRFSNSLSVDLTGLGPPLPPMWMSPMNPTAPPFESEQHFFIHDLAPAEPNGEVALPESPRPNPPPPVPDPPRPDSPTIPTPKSERAATASPREEPLRSASAPPELEFRTIYAFPSELHHPRPQHPVSPLLSDESLGRSNHEISPVSPLESTPTTQPALPTAAAAAKVLTGAIPPTLRAHVHGPDFVKADEKFCPFCIAKIPVGHLMTQQLAAACTLVNLKNTIDRSLLAYKPSDAAGGLAGEAKEKGKGKTPLYKLTPLKMSGPLGGGEKSPAATDGVPGPKEPLTAEQKEKRRIKNQRQKQRKKAKAAEAAEAEKAAAMQADPLIQVATSMQQLQDVLT